MSDLQIIRRIGERGLYHAQCAGYSNQVDLWQHLLDELSRVPGGEKQKGRRTDQQRKAIEVYCRELATALNDAGCDQRKVLAAMKEGVEIPWCQRSCKDTLWRRIQIAVVEKDSTTQLTKDEVSEVYEILNRWTAQTFGVSVPFPSEGG